MILLAGVECLLEARPQTIYLKAWARRAGRTVACCYGMRGICVSIKWFTGWGPVDSRPLSVEATGVLGQDGVGAARVYPHGVWSMLFCQRLQKGNRLQAVGHLLTSQYLRVDL